MWAEQSKFTPNPTFSVKLTGRSSGTSHLNLALFCPHNFEIQCVQISLLNTTGAFHHKAVFFNWMNWLKGLLIELPCSLLKQKCSCFLPPVTWALSVTKIVTIFAGNVPSVSLIFKNITFTVSIILGQPNYYYETIVFSSFEMN